MASNEVLQLRQMQQSVYEANVNSLTADINITYIDVDRKQELLSDFKEKLEIQAEELRITKHHLGRVQEKSVWKRRKKLIH